MLIHDSYYLCRDQLTFCDNLKILTVRCNAVLSQRLSNWDPILKRINLLNDMYFFNSFQPIFSFPFAKDNLILNQFMKSDFSY